MSKKTIGADTEIEGNLTVDRLTTLTGSVTASSTVAVQGVLTADVTLNMTGDSSPAIASSGQGKIRFNTTRFEVSQNGGAYFPVGTVRPPNVITYSSTPVFDLSLSNNMDLTLTGNVVSSTWLNLTEGQEVTVVIVATDPGTLIHHTFVWPTNTFGATACGNDINIQKFLTRSGSLWAIT